MDISNDLFKLLKQHKWNEFKDIINKQEDLDLNIRDKSNNYLIQYAILYNKIEIVELLIKKGAKLDIIDSDGRIILFYPIKFNYNDILTLLLKYDKDTIGISLLELADKNNYYPIHYTILFNNFEALKIILSFNTNINQPTDDGNTSLHLAITTKNRFIINYILDKKPDINYQTNQGETALHIACNFRLIDIIIKLLELGSDVNIQDFENQITPLMYSVILDDINIFNLLLEKSDMDIQDINGNNVLHYAISEKNLLFIDPIVEKIQDINTTNLLSKTPLHLLLDNLPNDNSKFNLVNIIKKSDLNIQDNNGNSSFLLLVKLNLWKKLYDVLKTKKLNAYLKNHDDKSTFDFLEKSDEFLNLLVEAYIHILKSIKIEFKNDIDNLCKSNISKEKYDKLNLNLDIDESLLDKKNVCNSIIKQMIVKNKNSIPIKLKSYCLDLDYSNNVNFITYTGVTLDVLFGLIYINNSDVNTSLTINFKDNQELKSHYENTDGRNISQDELLNFEIIWTGTRIFYPTIMDEILKTNKRFIIIPIGIELSTGSHANMLIIDKETNEIERFEPNGGSFPFKFNYNPELLDSLLKDYFNNKIPNIKYFEPNDFLPKIGFQFLEAFDFLKNKKIGDPGGFCASWSSWWAFMRTKYPNIDRKVLVIKLIRKIKELNIPFKNLIRNFSKKIIDIRDEILTEANLDINDWINGNYTNAQIDNFILLIQQKIKSNDLVNE